MEVALYLASMGFTGIWFSPGKEQTKQPMKYMQFIIENSYLKYLLDGDNKTEKTFITGGAIRIVNLTELNARSPRADFVVYDEQAQADEAAYRAAVSILSVTMLGLIFNISTPVKGTIFEENYIRLLRMEREIGTQLVFSRTWRDVSYLEAKADWYEEQKRVLPDWYFRQEHEASFESPSGAVFRNVIYDTYPEWLQAEINSLPNLSGVDWNPAAGHCRVSVKWLPQKLAIVVTGESMFSGGYSRDMREEEFSKLTPYFCFGARLTMESGGINEEYVKWFYDMIDETLLNHPEQQFYFEEWDSQGLNKMNACLFIIQHGITIYVDKYRFPNTAREIENCHWDEEAKGDPKIAKDDANSPHYLDSFLHAISIKNRDNEQYEITSWN